MIPIFGSGANSEYYHCCIEKFFSLGIDFRKLTETLIADEADFVAILTKKRSSKVLIKIVSGCEVFKDVHRGHGRGNIKVSKNLSIKMQMQ